MNIRHNAYEFITTVALLCPIGAQGEDLSSEQGAFADIGYGARPMGMGGAYVGLSDDSYALLWNPAGLVGMQRNESSLMWTNQTVFFFSSRRRHTRYIGDWSSDVALPI